MTTRIDLYAAMTSRCTFAPRGWRCKIGVSHFGPCPAVPAWWNLKARWRFRGRC